MPMATVSSTHDKWLTEIVSHLAMSHEIMMIIAMVVPEMYDTAQVKTAVAVMKANCTPQAGLPTIPCT